MLLLLLLLLCAGMSPGHYQGAQGIGGPNMGGPAAQPGPPSSGAPRASGGGGGQAAPAAAATAAAAPTDASGQRYNIMPAEDLMLDARHYDKQLLDPSCGQLQLLRALMQADAWEAAVLMLQWLQVCRTIPAHFSRTSAVSTLLCLVKPNSSSSLAAVPDPCCLLEPVLAPQQATHAVKVLPSATRG
jgi:hypothetical protein